MKSRSVKEETIVVDTLKQDMNADFRPKVGS